MVTDLQCPKCAAVLASVNGNGLELRQAGPLVADADAIPSTPDSLGSYAAMATALVGTCSECASPYWLLEYLIFPGNTDALLDYLALNDVMTGELAAVSDKELPDLTWLTWERWLPTGPVRCHQIGPIGIPDGATPYGRNGVSACGNGPFWMQARETALRAFASIEKGAYLVEA